MRDGVLIQEEYSGDDPDLVPWRTVIVSLMCVQTTGAQVRRVLGPLFEQWPTPSAMAHAGEELERTIASCGFAARRGSFLRNTSFAFARWMEAEDGRPSHSWVRGLRGCGQYVEEAYAFLIEGDRSFRPVDKELRKAWNRDRGLR